MIQTSIIVSSPSRGEAQAYLAECLKESRLARQLGSAFPECGDVFLITASDPPAGQSYFSGWGSPPSGPWLFEEVSRYLRRTSGSLALFEDFVSSPSDPFLATRDHPPYWCYRDKLFWPVTASGADDQNVEETMAWAAPIRVIALTRIPPELTEDLGTIDLSDQQFRQIASSIERLVIDVFDGEGFMVWERKAE